MLNLLLCITILALLVYVERTSKKKVHSEEEISKALNLYSENQELKKSLKVLAEEVVNLKGSLQNEQGRNAVIVSQKKSSESKIGSTVENLIPMLHGLPYVPQNLHHLSQPIDYVYFNYEEAEIVFIEVKSMNSKESKRQKTIKNAIRLGKVFYEELRINKDGINIKRASNLE